MEDGAAGQSGGVLGGSTRKASGIHRVQDVVAHAAATSPEAARRALERGEPMLLVECGSGRVAATNKAALDVFGYSETEIAGRALPDLVRIEPALKLQGLRSEFAWSGPWTHRRQDATTFQADVGVSAAGGTFAMILIRMCEPAARPASRLGAFPHRLSRTLLGLGPAPFAIEFPAESLEDVDPRELVQPLITKLLPAADAKKVNLVVTCSLPSIRVQPAMFVRALRELGENAIAASHRDRPVFIALDETEAGDALVQVADSGRGMSRAALTKIGETVPGSRVGTGCGTCFARAVVEGHHGLLHFATTPNRGTTASIWLPAASGRRASHD